MRAHLLVSEMAFTVPKSGRGLSFYSLSSSGGRVADLDKGASEWETLVRHMLARESGSRKTELAANGREPKTHSPKR